LPQSSPAGRPARRAGEFLEDQIGSVRRAAPGSSTNLRGGLRNEAIGTGRVAGKVAVVSGGEQRHSAARPSSCWDAKVAKVVGTARREELLKEALEEVERHGGEGAPSSRPTWRSRGAAESVVQAALDAYGRIDILVCNAGGRLEVRRRTSGDDGRRSTRSRWRNWQDVIGGRRPAGVLRDDARGAALDDRGGKRRDRQHRLDGRGDRVSTTPTPTPPPRGRSSTSAGRWRSPTASRTSAHQHGLPGLHRHGDDRAGDRGLRRPRHGGRAGADENVPATGG